MNFHRGEISSTLRFNHFWSDHFCRSSLPRMMTIFLCGIGTQCSKLHARTTNCLMPMMLPTANCLPADPDPNGPTSFLQLGLLGMLEWDLRPTIWLQLAMPLWLGKPSTSSLRNSLTLLPCLAKFPKNANVMGKSIFRLHKGREGCQAFPCQSHAWGNFRGR